MTLIAEQLRNGQIELAEALRRAADKVFAANLPALEYILRHAEGVLEGTRIRVGENPVAAPVTAINLRLILS